MTWPIPILPTAWANSTPQLDNHPAAHNALADAVNELAARAARGIVGLAVGLTSTYTTASTSETDITVATGDAPTLTLALDTARRYRAVFDARWGSSVAGDVVQVRLMEGATQRAAGLATCPTSVGITLHFEYIFTPVSAAPTIYKMLGSRQGGTGTVSLFASATSPIQFSIQDLGKV